MNPELERLWRALHAAHAAGDTAAAQQFAQAIRRMESAPESGALNAAMMRGDTATARALVEEHERPKPPQQFGGGGGFAGTPESGAGASFGDDPRQAGRKYASAQMRRTRAVPGEMPQLGPALQGLGSSALGVGTPITAAGEFISSRFDKAPGSRSWGESLEFARGYREQSYEEEPGAYRTGFGAGLVGGVKATTAALSKAPAAVKSVFTLQAAKTGETLSRLQKAQNAARLSATGAATAGVTAGMQEGTEAVPGAVIAGGVLGPVAPLAVAGAVGGVRRVASWINPDAAAIRALAARFKLAPSVVAERYNALASRLGGTRKPRLAEIDEELAGEVGLLTTKTKYGATDDARKVLREAGEAAEVDRQFELPPALNRGALSTSVPQLRPELEAVTDEARTLVNSRVRSTAADETRRQGKLMDKIMGRIGSHRVAVNAEMLEILEHPEMQTAVGPVLRARINDAIEHGKDIGTIAIPVGGEPKAPGEATWEMIRYELAQKASAGKGRIFSRYRDQVRKYVGGIVPEYEAALAEFGRRAETIAGLETGRKALSEGTHAFSAMLREKSPSLRVGARVDVRTTIAKAFGGTPVEAERMMKQLVRDNRLRANLREVLSPAEMNKLNELAERYGYSLNIEAGEKVGRTVLTSDTKMFEDAVNEAASVPGGQVGVQSAVRGKLVARAGSSPKGAVQVASALEKQRGLQDRIRIALGGPEAADIQKTGEVFSRAARGMAAVSPKLTEAQATAAAQSQKTNDFISGMIIAVPPHRYSAAFFSHFLNNMALRFKYGRGTLTRMAEMSVDPQNAPKFLAMMKKQGVSDAELLKWYREAALAAGIVVGQ